MRNIVVIMSSARSGWSVFAVLASLLLCATLCWHFPLMLWDHLDFVPIYSGWLNGDLLHSGFMRNHNGHLYVAEYSVLLLTTWASHGRPWLDCLASWFFLVGYAAIVYVIARRTLAPDGSPMEAGAVLLILFLALYPGHLANLQWGWQVGVFLCLLASAAAIALLTAERMSAWTSLLALALTGVALESFATGFALVPIALAALVLRPGLRWQRKLALLAPWMAVLFAALFALRSTARVLSSFSADSVTRALGRLDPLTIALYVVDYLGAGIARIAPAVAPWLAAAAIVSGVSMSFALRGERRAWPWAAFFVYGGISAALTALARFGEGAQQAFVSRYVSFSALFWIGWIGLFVLYARGVHSRALRSPVWVGLVAALALANAAQISLESARFGASTRDLAQTLCKTYPQLDDGVLADMYYAGAAAARDRLAVLRSLGFAPFDACAAGSVQQK